MIEYGCLRMVEMLLKRNGSVTYGITIRSRISVFVHYIQTKTLVDLIRKMEIPLGEVESENYGFQHTHLDERFYSTTKSKQN